MTISVVRPEHTNSMQITGCAALLAAILLIHWFVDALGWSGLFLLIIALKMTGAVLNLLVPNRHG